MAMSEFEIYEAVCMTSDLGMNYSQYLLSVLTGYLLIAYFIGSNLARFQVSFAIFCSYCSMDPYQTLWAEF
jgi:hypothetical protein